MDYIKCRELSFGEKLHLWRMENQFSRNDVANILVCSCRTVGTWERGEKLPGYDSIIAVSKMMNVSSDWLLGL